MMRSVDRPVAGALLWSRDGHLLLGKRRSGRGPWAGLWQAPGGGVAPGESAVTAVVREIAEETGLEVPTTALTLIDSDGRDSAEKQLESGETVWVQMRFFMFEALLEKESAELRLSPGDEFEELRWFTRGELKTIEIVPAGVELLERLGILEAAARSG